MWTLGDAVHCMHSMQDTCFACRSQVWGWLPHCFACSKTVWITAWHTVHSVTLTPLVQLHENERSDHIQQVCGLSLVDCVQCVIAGVLGDVAVEGHTVRYW